MFDLVGTGFFTDGIRLDARQPVFMGIEPHQYGRKVFLGIAHQLARQRIWQSPGRALCRQGLENDPAAKQMTGAA